MNTTGINIFNKYFYLSLIEHSPFLLHENQKVIKINKMSVLTKLFIENDIWVQN